MQDSDEWEMPETSSSFSGFEYPFEFNPKRRKTTKPCGKKQPVAKNMSLSLNAISEDFSDDPVPIFTNAPRTFVCEHRGRTPKKSHKASSPSPEKRTHDNHTMGLSLLKYQGMGLNSGNDISPPIFEPMEKDSKNVQTALENLGNAAIILKSDIKSFNEALSLKKRGWDQLKLECLSVLNELNICDKCEPIQVDWTIPQQVQVNSETVRLAIDFLQNESAIRS
jgi:hypothetical protein